MKRYGFFMLALVPVLAGCTEKLERRIANLEGSIRQLESGMIANDRSLRQDMQTLKGATESRFGQSERAIAEVRGKTDQFCVVKPDDPTDPGIELHRAGHCR